MKLNPPKQVTWVIALILGILGILAYLLPLGGISALAFWLVVIAFLLLIFATVMEGV